MKVVFLSASPHLGGAERVLLDAIDGLKAIRPTWDFTALLPADGPLVDAVETVGARAIVVPYPAALAAIGESEAGCGGPRHGRWWGRALMRSGPTLAYACALRRQLRHLRPDIVHSNGHKMHLFGAWAKPARTRLIWHMHDFLTGRANTTRLLRWHAAACDAAVANSISVTNDVQQVFHAKALVVTVRNGVNLARFSPDGPLLDLDECSALPPAPAETLRVGLVGTFARWKGHVTFLEAVARLPACLNVRAYVVGAPVYSTAESQHTHADLQAAVRRLGLTGRVGFTGFVEDTARTFRALDVVVHASTTPEPFGLVVAEAMACGRAVVTSGSGGPAEFIEPEKNVLVHAPGDAMQLSAQMSRLLESASLRESLARHAHATAQRILSRERFAEQMAELYERLVHQPPAAARVDLSRAQVS